MMTRSIVGRFLILAVLLVSLGVIAQAALIISRGSGKAVATADAAAAPAPAAAVAALTPAPAAAPVSPAAQPASSADAAPVRVVYPGPLGDAPVQPRKFADAAPATPVAPTPVAPAAPVAPTAAPVPAAIPPAPAAEAAAPAPAKTAPVVVAAAEADTQPTADAPPANKGGIDLNSASVDVLNHLGGGHIGQTIVKHRPYSSVEDLVKKRVVRRSVYEQIKNQVAAQ